MSRAHLDNCSVYCDFLRWQVSTPKLCLLFSCSFYLLASWTVPYAYKHTQHFVPIVSHFRRLEDLLVLSSAKWILDGSLWNQMEGLIMHCIPWQRQSPTPLAVITWVTRCSLLHTAIQGGRNYAEHWGLLKAALIFRKQQFAEQAS